MKRIDLLATQFANNVPRPISLSNQKYIKLVGEKIFYNRRVNQNFKYEENKRLAILVPYRNREKHREQFIPYMSHYLRKQNIDFTLYLIEQADQKPLNIGALRNVGAHLAQSSCDYYCLHDIDFLPINLNYNYCNFPMRMFHSFESGQKVLYETYFSGAVLFAKEDFYRINGYSNSYLGWGSEDDDLFFRCIYAGLVPHFDPQGVVKELPHPSTLKQDISGRYHNAVLSRNRKLRRKNFVQFRKVKRTLVNPHEDGLNNLKFKLISKEQFNDHVLIKVTF